MRKDDYDPDEIIRHKYGPKYYTTKEDAQDRSERFMDDLIRSPTRPEHTPRIHITHHQHDKEHGHFSLRVHKEAKET